MRNQTTKQKTKARTGKLVYIRWLDHVGWTQNNWHDIDDTKLLTPSVIDTVGWIVKETKKHIIVASIITDNGNTNGEICIIKGCIVKRKNLK